MQTPKPAFDRSGHRTFYPVLERFCRLGFIPYLLAVFWITFLRRQPTCVRYNLVPFWEYRELLFGTRQLFFLGQIVGNLVMLLPLGCMLPVLFERYRSGGRTILLSMEFSVLIELSQLVSARGLCEFDDVFNNTLGAAAGYLLYTWIARLPKT